MPPKITFSITLFPEQKGEFERLRRRVWRLGPLPPNPKRFHRIFAYQGASLVGYVQLIDQPESLAMYADEISVREGFDSGKGGKGPGTQGENAGFGLATRLMLEARKEVVRRNYKLLAVEQLVRKFIPGSGRTFYVKEREGFARPIALPDAKKGIRLIRRQN